MEPKNLTDSLHQAMNCLSGTWNELNGCLRDLDDMVRWDKNFLNPTKEPLVNFSRIHPKYQTFMSSYLVLGIERNVSFVAVCEKRCSARGRVTSELLFDCLRCNGYHDA